MFLCHWSSWTAFIITAMNDLQKVLEVMSKKFEAQVF